MYWPLRGIQTTFFGVGGERERVKEGEGEREREREIWAKGVGLERNSHNTTRPHALALKQAKCSGNIFSILCFCIFVQFLSKRRFSVDVFA